MVGFELQICGSGSHQFASCAINTSLISSHSLPQSQKPVLARYVQIHYRTSSLSASDSSFLKITFYSSFSSNPILILLLIRHYHRKVVNRIKPAIVHLPSVGSKLLMLV